MYNRGTLELYVAHYNPHYKSLQPFCFEHENIAGVVAARVGDHTANAIEVHGALEQIRYHSLIEESIGAPWVKC